MTQEISEAAAAARVEGGRVVAIVGEVHERLRPLFARVKPFEQARKYVVGLMSDLPRKNGWTLAEHAGDRTPDRTQRLLNKAVWDHDRAQGVVRRFVAEQLGGESLRVAALDESGQEKAGTATAGVKRQYLGCAGRVANGVNTVYCSYASSGGHGLVAARVYVPAEQLADPDQRERLGIGDEVVFRTKPQLAVDLLTEMIADETMPPWVAGDEVYGRSSELRAFLQDNNIGYVLRVGCAFRVELASRKWMRADAVAATYLKPRRQKPKRWQVYSVTGSKGERAYAWAWVATKSPNHFLLLRKHLLTGEIAYHYCYVPTGHEPVTLMALVRVACLRWPVEEGLCATRRSVVFPV